MRYILRIKGNWNDQKEKLKKKFVNLSDNDLVLEDGKNDEMLEKLSTKLGKTKQELITLINKL
jgi:uncharacterized protein YjbJ (UPF0337 family)